tara:strand:- start:4051 stop:6270 length:2220 start_codon:yes stop_codon:yes gene_type:complete
VIRLFTQPAVGVAAFCLMLAPLSAMRAVGQDAAVPTMSLLPEMWRYRTDPDKVGEKERWFAPGWKGTPWQWTSTHGFWPRYEGDGWYALDQVIPPATGGEMWLIFGAVDENYTLWINGDYIADNLDKGTSMWDKSAAVNITGRYRQGASNHLVVRVRNTRGAGGIWKPSALVRYGSTSAETARREPAAPELSRDDCIERAVAEARRQNGERDPVFVTGFAPSTQHIFLEDRPFAIDVAREGRLLAVRGEKEALQLVILANVHDLTNVEVSVSALAGEHETIPASAVTVNPVGFVKIDYETSSPFPDETPYLGWWPDPLLENFAFDVDRGNTQPVCISVRIPQTLAAGVYTGTITVRPGNAPARELALAVDVADVDLPTTWHFRNLLCWDDGYGPMVYGDRWTEQLRDKFIEFQLERRLNVGGLSGSTQKRVTVDDMVAYVNRGQNAVFAYQFHGEQRMRDGAGKPLTELPKSSNDTLPGPGPVKLRQWAPKLQAAGCYDRAFVYGWDERGEDYYWDIRMAAELLARDYPGLPLLMAGVDNSCGTASTLNGLTNIIYCPAMRQWDADAVHKAQAQGTEVWWYDIHWTIEQHLIRSRLIPWQTYKVGADGFLIWVMNWWHAENKPLSGTQVRIPEWNARGPIASSSGMYIYPGRDGPLSSLRLENFCDGIEDYDLLATAEALLGRSGADAAVADKLRDALYLEDEFIRDAVSYSTDPALLTDRRRVLIEALAAAAESRVMR